MVIRATWADTRAGPVVSAVIVLFCQTLALTSSAKPSRGLQSIAVQGSKIQPWTGVSWCPVSTLRVNA